MPTLAQVPALLLGAGASVASGLPDWATMMASLEGPLEDGMPADGQRLVHMLDVARRSTDLEDRLRGLIVTGAVAGPAQRVAAEVLRSAGVVLTVNWDNLIESACSAASVPLHVLTSPEAWPCSCALGHLLKLHGEPHLLPVTQWPGLDGLPDWSVVLADALAGRSLGIFGWSGRDIDVMTALLNGMGEGSIDWFALPDTSSTLAAALGPLATRCVLHEASDPSAQLEAWASAKGLRPPADEKVQQLLSLTDLAPRILGLIDVLGQRPEALPQMDSRSFEELVAGLLASSGYQVELTQGSKDGGVDVVAVRVDPLLGQLRYLVQCKRYAEANKVEVAPVRELFGLVSATGATGGLVVTSGFFTRGAKAFRDSAAHRMALHDQTALRKWIEEVRRNAE